MRKIGRRLAALAVAALVGTGFLMATAAPSFASSCEINRYGKDGLYVCGTHHTDLTFTTGQGITERAFIIGIDYAVWNIVRYPNGTVNGWASLGRINGFTEFNGARIDPTDPYHLTIYATDRLLGRMCNTLNNGWRGWTTC